MVKVREKKPKMWFRAKEYGWGWYPISWEGWINIGIFVIAYVFSLVWLLNQKSILNVIAGIVIILFLFAVLFFLCYKKGEKPGWRWHGKLVKKGVNKK
jgi:hypothetical protein